MNLKLVSFTNIFEVIQVRGNLNLLFLTAFKWLEWVYLNLTGSFHLMLGPVAGGNEWVLCTWVGFLCGIHAHTTHVLIGYTYVLMCAIGNTYAVIHKQSLPIEIK